MQTWFLAAQLPHVAGGSRRLFPMRREWRPAVPDRGTAWSGIRWLLPSWRKLLPEVLDYFQTHQGKRDDQGMMRIARSLASCHLTKALVRVDAICKACLTNLDCAQECLFTEVEHPV